MSAAQDPLSALRAKESAASQQQVPQSAPAAAPAGSPDDQNADKGDSSVSDESIVAGEGVNLHRAFSRLQESVTALLDNLGCKRSGTVKHIDGETMSAH